MFKLWFTNVFILSKLWFTNVFLLSKLCFSNVSLLSKLSFSDCFLLSKLCFSKMFFYCLNYVSQMFFLSSITDYCACLYLGIQKHLNKSCLRNIVPEIFRTYILVKQNSKLLKNKYTIYILFYSDVLFIQNIHIFNS